MNIFKLVLAVDDSQFPDCQQFLDDFAESLKLTMPAASTRWQKEQEGGFHQNIGLYLRTKHSCTLSDQTASSFCLVGSKGEAIMQSRPVAARHRTSEAQMTPVVPTVVSPVVVEAELSVANGLISLARCSKPKSDGLLRRQRQRGPFATSIEQLVDERTGAAERAGGEATIQDRTGLRRTYGRLEERRVVAEARATT
ncbi:hypothetical protein EJB05_57326, partial [Eragrostis curvula]